MHSLLKGRSFPGKILITRRSDPVDPSILPSPNIDRRSPESDRDHSEQVDRSTEVSIFIAQLYDKIHGSSKVKTLTY